MSAEQVAMLAVVLVVFAALWVVGFIATKNSPTSDALCALTAQHEESRRHSEAMNNKLVQQLMAVAKPVEYMNFRKGDAVGVPSGSTQPVQDHSRPEGMPRASKNGQQLTPQQVASAAAAALRDTMGETGPLPVVNPADYQKD